MIVLTIPIFVVAIRVIVLFPVVAVDAPGPNWRQAMADTSGHAWSIFLIIVGPMLALFIVISVAGYILFLIIGDTGIGSGR